MKVMFISVLLMFTMTLSYGLAEDEFLIQIDEGGAKFTVAQLQGITFQSEIPSFKIRTKEANGKTYKMRIGGKTIAFEGDGKEHEITFSPSMDMRGKEIEITDSSGGITLIKFKSGESGDNKSTPPLPGISDIFVRTVRTITSTPYGVQLKDSLSRTKYKGEKYIHLFFDPLGNCYLTTVPQGISNYQYVVHLFYLMDVKNPSRITYSVNQTEGVFDNTIVFNNADGLSTFDPKGGEEEASNIPWKWTHREFLLSTSTTDIKFEIYRNQSNAETNEAKKTLLATHVIKMSKVYHGSFDIGMLRSGLKNPTYEHIASAGDSEAKVVKMSEGGNRGVMTAMATFYTSPVVLLGKLLLGKKVLKYKLTGRSYLNDHKLLERIYPAIGIGLSDKALENLFFGLNWEFARGGSVFAGVHYGKVNVFEVDEEFEFGETVVTEAEFSLKQNTRWKAAFAVGVNLDIMIVKNLFKK
ncbi:MAG: hypothetical protein GY757_47880 [bacterium]|nr:hypothetical protein [bacterium]